MAAQHEGASGIPPEPKDSTSTQAQKEPEKTPAVEDEIEDFPDPDEDDLDDLDEFLDDFAAPKSGPKTSIPQPTPATPSAGPPATPSAGPSTATPPVPGLAGEDELLDDELSKELEKGMADFFSGLESNPDMQAEFQEMFRKIAEAAGDAPPEGSSANAAPATPPRSKGEPSKPASDADFQETIRRTMERMKTSGDKTTEDLSKDESPEMFNDLLGLLGSGLGGEGSSDELNKMLMGMMEQLTNKEILYEPMKELHEQFPGWLEKNKGKVSEEDLKRYEEQRVIVAEIVAKFDEPSYSDSNTEQREYIVERMQKMQATGSPPPDLVGDLNSAQEALNAPNDEACNPQ
ncbi:related to PEX19 protein [Cephalotrichum gorgonifer]|uniref:Related to PEX19 protein n=1 Tax=Cephalotrichum gorgonifer TaxID=2041049 RepID=A0AAE8SRS5_9PEZI|nr:related to PEX19 protein [Cephalotrichum gorgonifer]